MLSNRLYKKMVKNMPIICVDAIIIYKGKVLLVKRKNRPEKGKYFIPGGRIYKNERFCQAIKRKIKEEIGNLSISSVEPYGWYEYFAKDSEFGTSTHSVGLTYLVNLKKEPVIKLDKTSEDYKWVCLSDFNKLFLSKRSKLKWNL